MTVTVEPGLVDALAARSGNAQVELHGSSNADVARRAMKAARAAVYTVRHPEEPDEPLPSYVTEVEEGRHGPGFSIDRPEHYLAVLCSSDLADLVIARDLVPRSLSR